MLKVGPVRLPQWAPRAMSVALSMALLVGAGQTLRYHFYQIGESKVSHYLYKGEKWAAITCMMVSGPIVGGIVRVAGQRIVGTLSGGVIGLCVRWLSFMIPQTYLALLFAVTASIMGYTGVWLSELMPQEGTTSQLFVVTFVMVFAEGHSMQDSFMLFAGRSGGIIVGILLSLLFTVFVLPSSAHNEADGKLSDALRGLRRLNGLIWLPLSGTPLLAAQHGGSSGTPQGGDARGDRDDVAAHVRVWVGDCDKSSSEDVADTVFASLRTAESMLEPAQFEIFAGYLAGRSYYFPRILACCMGRRREFPHDRMQTLCHNMRRVARIQLGMVSLFDSGAADEEAASLQASSLSKDTLPGLVESLDCVLQECLEAFPRRPSLEMRSCEDVHTHTSQIVSAAGLAQRRMHASSDDATGQQDTSGAAHASQDEEDDSRKPLLPKERADGGTNGSTGTGSATTAPADVADSASDLNALQDMAGKAAATALSARAGSKDSSAPDGVTRGSEGKAQQQSNELLVALAFHLRELDGALWEMVACMRALLRELPANAVTRQRHE